MWNSGAALHAVRESLEDVAPARVAGARSARRSRRAWPSTWWWTCSPRPAAGKSTKDVIADARRAAQADLQSRELAMAVTATPTAAQPLRSRRRERRFAPLDLEREGGVQLADAHAAGVLFLLALRRLSVLLRHLAEPAEIGRSPRPAPSSGLANFVADSRTTRCSGRWPGNTFVYTIVDDRPEAGRRPRHGPGDEPGVQVKNIVRALLLLPFIVPTVLSTIAWMWILDPTFSVINWVLVHSGASPSRVLLARQRDAWRWCRSSSSTPGAACRSTRITLLAGLQTISPDLYEAATIDGASAWPALPLRDVAAASSR